MIKYLDKNTHSELQVIQMMEKDKTISGSAKTVLENNYKSVHDRYEYKNLLGDGFGYWKTTGGWL